MKLCSQCHFTFEDQEEICDFDGTPLTACVEKAPSFESVEAKLDGPKTRLRLLTAPYLYVTLFALTAVLASTLMIVYRESIGRKSSTASLVESPASEITPTDNRSRPKSRRRTRVVKSIKVVARLAPRARSPRLTEKRAAKATAAYARVHTTPSPNTPPIAAHQRSKTESHSDSKVTAILKKTGSVFKKTVSLLKKPFDF